MLSPVLIYLCRAVLTSQPRQSPHSTGDYPRCVKRQAWSLKAFQYQADWIGKWWERKGVTEVGWWTWQQPGILATSSSSSSFSFLTVFSQANAEQINQVNSLQAVEDLHYLPLKRSCHQDRLPFCCVKSLKPVRWICRSASVSQEMSLWLSGILSYCIDSQCIYIRVCHCSAFKILFWRKECSQIQSSACKQWNSILVKMKGVCTVYAQILFPCKLKEWEQFMRV